MASQRGHQEPATSLRGKTHLAAAIDRLVHRATIFELNVESYRRRTAIDHKRSRQRAAASDGEAADQTAGAPRRPLRNGAQ